MPLVGSRWLPRIGGAIPRYCSATAIFVFIFPRLMCYLQPKRATGPQRKPRFKLESPAGPTMDALFRTASLTKRIILVGAALLIWPTGASAQVKVLISGGFSGAYERLLPEFERTSGIKVTTGSGSSQGTGPQTISAQLARGVSADVVILSREGLNELIAANRIADGTDVDLARTPLGVAVRARTPKPDVSTVETFKQVLLKAKTVAIPGSTGG